MTHNQAVRTVALHLVSNLVEMADDEWGNYPEIGEYDFDEVMRIANDLIKRPTKAEFDEAYDYLKLKAEQSQDYERQA